MKNTKTPLSYQNKPGQAGTSRDKPGKDDFPETKNRG